MEKMIVRIKKLPLLLTGTVIDIETTGFPWDGAEIITLGTVSGDKLKIVQRTNERNFDRLARAELKNLPRPYYAFNKTFEEEMLKISIERELQVQQYERKRDAIQVAGLHDPFRGQGVHVIGAWDKYNSTKDESHLQQIIDHNENCLLLETCLVLIRWSK